MHVLERNYDGIIIGAGHHGLVLGAYLAKAGLDILVVERRLDYGGGLSTKEVTEPGFYHNLHSINHFHISETPWFKDLGLGERVTYITPRYEFGQAHSDGTALVLGRDLEETVANIARFSKKDAATFREWNRKGERITEPIGLVDSVSTSQVPNSETLNRNRSRTCSFSNSSCTTSSGWRLVTARNSRPSMVRDSKASRSVCGSGSE